MWLLHINKQQLHHVLLVSKEIGSKIIFQVYQRFPTGGVAASIVFFVQSTLFLFAMQETSLHPTI